MEYRVKKKEFKKENISELEIHFDNGDYFTIKGNEILDISLKLEDKLIAVDNSYHRCFTPVVFSGFIKLCLKYKQCKDDKFLYNVKEYNKNRILYIKNRLLNEGGVRCVKLYDENNWSFTLYGKVKAESVNEDIILSFSPINENEPYESEYHKIRLPELRKSEIESIMLDFENCESVTIESSEINNYQIKFDAELEWGSNGYVRKIETGYLYIVLDSSINAFRKNDFFIKFKSGKEGNKTIRKRICGKKRFDLHDICHLYITYTSHTLTQSRECIEIQDIRSDEEFLAIEKMEEKTGHEYYPYCVGGYSELDDEGDIIILFGKEALKNDTCQELLLGCSVLNSENV